MTTKGRHAGKASRNKSERRRNATDIAAQRAWTELQQITLAVSYATGSHAQCIAGVALLVETAKLFGHTLTPRAVSMVGQSTRNPGQTVVTGDLGIEFIRQHGGSTRVGGMSGAPRDGSEFQRAGHLIATSEDPPALLDPTFGQFNAAGLPDLVPVNAIDPNATEWPVDDDSLLFLYIVDDANRGWQDGYELVREQSLSEAVEIANHLKSGGRPDTHPIRL